MSRLTIFLDDGGVMNNNSLTILVTNSPYPETGTTRHIGSLAELPEILQK